MLKNFRANVLKRMNFLIMGVKGLNEAKRVLQEITVNLPFKKITSKSFSRAVILFVPSVSATSQGEDTNCNNKNTRAKMKELYQILLLLYFYFTLLFYFY